MNDAELTVDARLIQLFGTLGLTRVHLAGALAQDYRGLLTSRPDMVASLSLISPGNLDPTDLAEHAQRLLLIHGDQGPNAPVIPRAMPRLPGAREVVLPGFADASWANPTADRADEVHAAMLGHIQETSRQTPVPAVSLPAEDGEVAEIHYSLRGSGPPLVLMPLALSAAQWEPLVERLSAQFTTIVLSGARLGMVSQLEERMASPWYQGILQTLISVARLKPSDRVVEVGCGAGAVVRWLANATRGANPITAVDINRYLMREAEALARAEGVAEYITFQEGNAEALPIQDGSYDMTLCVTVLEEGDSDRMLAELTRITRPGGRVAVMVRGTDLPWWLNLDVSPELRDRASRVALGGKAVSGCADASLGTRMVAAGLQGVQVCPQLATVDSEIRLQTILARIEAAVAAEQRAEWQAAVEKARAAETLFIAQTYYCGVGTKAG